METGGPLPEGERPILVARGRDAADAPLTQTFGPNSLTGFEVWTRAAQRKPGMRQARVATDPSRSHIWDRARARHARILCRPRAAARMRLQSPQPALFRFT